MEGAQIGPYRVLGDLGSGGMGKVYLAEVAGHAPGLEDGCRVALKVIHPHLLERPGFFKRFLREAEIGKSVEQDNVVRCFDSNALVVDGHPQHYLVMEYVEGQTLRDLLNELERVPEELCRHIGREIAKGLVAIHDAGVIHRDLKPENVLITEDHVVKVMDLGVARLQDEAIRLSQTGAFVGSLEYASPEQFQGGGKDVDARSDLHALGVMLYELSTGLQPNKHDEMAVILRKVLHETPRRIGEVNPQLSPFFEEVVHTLVAKEPDERFDSASTLRTVLEDGENSPWWQERAQALRIQTKRPLRRIRIPRETALYGREDDLTKLRALYDLAKAGDGQVALVEGEAGIGKTRVVDEFAALLRQQGEDLNFLFGSYMPGGAATAAGAFSTAYRQHFGRDGLQATLDEYLSATPALVPAFAALLLGEPPPRGEEPLTRESLQTLFVHATRRLAAERPTIVLIDDLHFAPDAGRALFASLALSVPGHRILLVGTMRPEVPEAWTSDVTRLDHAAHMVLHRLGPKDLAHMLEDAFHSKRLADELGWLIAKKSDGNPFFAFEIIRGLREGMFITKGADGTWITTQVIQDVQVPSSVIDLVQARIADLDGAERELLDVASCCGFQFAPGLVAEAIGAGVVPTLRRLAHLEARHRIVRSAGENFVFDHHQVQESLYEALPPPLARAYHASIAQALARFDGADGEDPGDIDGVLAVEICTHALKGGQGERALLYLDAALAHLEQGYLNEEAVALSNAALEVDALLVGPRRAEVLLRKAVRLNLAGRRGEQEAALTEACQLADVQGDDALRVRAYHGLGAYYCAVSRMDEAQSRLQRAIDLARESDDQAGVVTALGTLGTVLHRLGRHKKAREYAERSLELARAAGSRRGIVKSTSNLATALWALGHYDEALLCNERCLEAFCESGDRQGEAHARANLGLVTRALGRFEEARAHNEEWLAIAREVGDRRGEAGALGSLGNVSWSLGLYDRAREHYERWLAIAQEIGDRGGEATAIGNLGLVAGALGHQEEAKGYHERHAGIAKEIHDLQGQATAALNLANVMASLGRYDEARETQSQCLSIVREIGDRHGECIVLINRGCLLASLGVLEESRATLSASLALSRESGAKEAEAHALLGLGWTARELDKGSDALEATEAALTLFREIEDSAGATEARIELGRCHTVAGKLDRAIAMFTEARSRTAELELLGADVLAGAHLAALGADTEAALAEFREHGSRLGHAQRMEARFLLWTAVKDPTHIQEAKRLLDHLVEHAPEEYRASMLKNVSLHRAIVQAWGGLAGEGNSPS